MKTPYPGGSGQGKPKLPHKTDTVVTWEELVLREPDLAILLELCESISSEDKPNFCANRLWSTVLRPVLQSLVGWYARQGNPLLRSSKAYDVAHQRCFDALPGCRNCQCW